MPSQPKHRIADELLVAQQTYQDAIDKHDAERNELSRRVLQECREQLEEAEFEAQLAGAVPELKCNDCGWVAVGERWVAPGWDGHNDGNDHVRRVEGNPGWAAEFVVQGVTQVTRYSCPECKTVLAILGVDV